MKKVRISLQFRRRFIAVFSVFVITVGAIIFLNKVHPVSAAWLDNLWSYRQAISISSHSSAEQNVYINVTINTSNTTWFQPDCGDLRFSDFGGNILPYYVVSGCTTSNTIIHVYFDSFPAGTQTIYFYYGNLSAQNGFSLTDFSTQATSYTIGSIATQEIGGGPVAWWKLDDGQGTAANDSSGKNNVGILVNSPTWQTEDQCISGNCLKFDGTSAYIDANNSSTLNSAFSLMTVELWIKPVGSYPSSEKFIIDKMGSMGQRGWQLGYETNGTLIWDYFNGPSGSEQAVQTNSSIPLNQWSHIVVNFSSSNYIDIYINGKLDKHQTNGVLNAVNGANTSSLQIAQRTTASGYFTGFIDDIKIYPYARTAAQIKQDYNAGIAGQAVSDGTELSAGVGSKSLSDGLVGYWKMDETIWTGTTGEVKDVSGNGYNGTSTNSTTTTGGKYGNAGSFDGVNNYVDVTNVPNVLNRKTEMTTVAWVKMSGNLDGQFRWIIRKTAGGYPFFFGVNSGNKLVLTINDQGYTLGVPMVNDTSWHHVVGVFKNSAIYYYVDGVFVGSHATTQSAVSDSTGTISLGGWTTYTQRWKGLIDELRIYSRALSPIEVKALYTYAPGPVGYWKMDEGNGTTALDSSGNGNNGILSTVVSTPSWSLGKMGKALRFDGNNNYITITNKISFPYDFTLSAWVNSNPKSRQVIFGNNQISSILSYYNGSVSFGTDGGSRVVWPNQPSDGIWHHISISAKRTIDLAELFVDGISRGTRSISGFDWTANNQNLWYIGRDISQTNLFSGSLDEVKVYNYARTQEQILQDMGANPPVAPRPGKPIAWYKFDEGTGTVANNSGEGGTSFNGTLTNGPTWTTGKINKGLSFDGSNDFGSIPNLVGTNLGSQYSITGWATTNTSNVSVLLSFGNDILVNSVINDMRWQNDGNGTYVKCSVNRAAGIWYHYAIISTGSSAGQTKFYLNGISCGNDGAVNSPSSNQLSIGKQGLGAIPRYWNGLIDEVKIYNYALSPDEVKQDFNQSVTSKVGQTTQTLSGTTTNLEYCIPGDTSPCAPPVGEWNFEEGKGTTANDTSGNGNTGTLGSSIYAPAWSVGKVGKSVNFDGNDFIDAGDPENGSLDFGTGDFSVNLWVKNSQPLLSSNDMYVPISKFSSNTEPGWSILLRGGYGFYLRIGASDGLQDITSTTNNLSSTMSDGNWHHIGFSRLSGVVTLYLDGVSAGSGIGNKNVSSTYRQLIGVFNLSKQLPFNGSIDQVRIYNYARTPAQIAYDYNKGAPIGWWKFDECQGTIAHDSSANRNDGTIVIGSTAPQTSVGTCTTAETAWGNGASGNTNGSLSFDGIDDYVNVGASSIFNFGVNSFSVSQWVKNPTGGNPSRSITKLSDTSTYNPGWYIQIQAGFFGWGAGDGTNAWLKNGVSYTFNTDTWYNVISIFNRNTKLFETYINGQKIASYDISSLTGAFDSANPILFGKRNFSVANYYQGQLEDIRIYNYALTSTQIQQIYNGSALNFH